MAVGLQQMALFPLSALVLPTVTMPLRIFEQRYLRLVRDCLRDSRPFGVVPIETGREVGKAPVIQPWGTVVSIVDWDQRDDGLLGINIRGEQVLHVEESWVEPDGLMQARVQLYSCDHEDNEKPIPSSFKMLANLLDDLTRHPAASVLRLEDDERNLGTLGWRLAQLLPVSKQFHQQFLQETCPWQRMEMLQRAVAEINDQ